MIKKILGSKNSGVTSCNATISPKNIGVKLFLQRLPYHAAYSVAVPIFFPNAVEGLCVISINPLHT